MELDVIMTGCSMLNMEWNSQMMPCIFNGDPLVIKYSEHFMYIGERMILWWGGTRKGTGSNVDVNYRVSHK